MSNLQLAMLVLAGGCVTTQLTPEAQAVRITSNPEAVRGCEVLGEVKGSDRMNGGMLGQGAAEENSRRRLRNAAAKLGANVVLVESANVAVLGGTSQRGEAYRCSTASPTP